MIKLRMLTSGCKLSSSFDERYALILWIDRKVGRDYLRVSVLFPSSVRTGKSFLVLHAKYFCSYFAL